MDTTTNSDLKRYIRDIPDFPKKGIMFKDIAPLLGHPEALGLAIRRMGALVPRPDAVVAIESRGFIFGTGLALHWGVRLVPARKFGKLPGRTVREQYSLEYGEDVLEIQADSLQPGQRAVVVDDLLATGGTAAAAGSLVEQLGGSVEAMLFLVELEGLGGRDKLAGRAIHSLIRFDLG